MKEITITTNKVNHLIDPTLHIWGWEVAVYLFLGGLTAGILIFSALPALLGKRENAIGNKLAIWAPVFLSLGMGCLFLDLEHKLFAFRFYTAFKVTSPMSWGSWILLIFYPCSILLLLATMRKGYPNAYQWLEKHTERSPFIQGKMRDFLDFCELKIKTWSAIALGVGIALGIYTGILLSAFGSRPFWNSALLGPLFLVSGASTAAAFAMLLTRDRKEVEFYNKADVALIGIELFLLALFIINMLSSSGMHIDAARLILGGKLTTSFWVFFVGCGLLLPIVIELQELKGRCVPRMVAPVLVLLGGLVFRFVILEAGQASTWIPY